MTDGVIATDRRGVIVIINDKAMEMLNISQEMALGVSILKVLKIDKEYTLRKLLENEDDMYFDFSND